MRAYTREDYDPPTLNMKKNLTIIILALIIIPLSVQAFSFEELFNELGELFSDEEWFSEEWVSNENGDSQVINRINVSTNTGDTVINGEVKEGETKSKVYVKNIINGTEIDPIEIESEANEVKVESEIKVEDDKAIVQREIQIDSETETETYEVDLEDADSCLSEMEACEGNLGETEESVTGSWWGNFVDNLKSFFWNIFSIF
ncbi:hypothetical protein KJA15_01145 [Patescibacteria group bacterium]|nr:hypothetical protein [Patescibacteria group bacterium]